MPRDKQPIEEIREHVMSLSTQKTDIGILLLVDLVEELGKQVEELKECIARLQAQQRFTAGWMGRLEEETV